MRRTPEGGNGRGRGGRPGAGSRSGSSGSNADDERKIPTYEERKAAYEEARARIFKDME
ncbi:hypothetical protein BCR43DRAFT_494394 [Syncephalastrum racemosum]|uniref:SUZ domain-containing protein n=1 Tax=Syncephalastrum racemosum TaxID=13706 RepID=A0A1X2H7X3_SYNRA|nr:hypothetical protein BCR43DRAFT_494394 [Syncephalastrum racemosum]